MQDLSEALDVRGGEFDAPAPVRVLRVEIPQPVEMGEFGAHAPEIVPGPAQNSFDLRRGFFREGRLQIIACDALLRQQRADCAHQPAGEIRHPVGIGVPQALEQSDRQRPDQRVAGAFCAATRPPDRSPVRIGH